MGQDFQSRLTSLSDAPFGTEVEHNLSNLVAQCSAFSAHECQLMWLKLPSENAHCKSTGGSEGTYEKGLGEDCSVDQLLVLRTILAFSKAEIALTSIDPYTI